MVEQFNKIFWPWTVFLRRPIDIVVGTCVLTGGKSEFIPGNVGDTVNTTQKSADIARL
jgi:hypothetical protein